MREAPQFVSAKIAISGCSTSTRPEAALTKLANNLGIHSKTVLTHVIEFSIFGGIVAALAVAVIRLK